MPILKDCVVMEDRVYCWDDTNKIHVEADLVVKPKSDVPDEARKLIAMKEFSLVENKDN
jgi:hypothetical protein